MTSPKPEPKINPKTGVIAKVRSARDDATAVLMYYQSLCEEGNISFAAMTLVFYGKGVDMDMKELQRIQQEGSAGQLDELTRKAFAWFLFENLCQCAPCFCVKQRLQNDVAAAYLFLKQKFETQLKILRDQRKQKK